MARVDYRDLGVVALRLSTDVCREISNLLQFNWSSLRSADSTENKNDVIYVLSYVGLS